MAKKKPRCAVCGSKRFSKDSNTGRIICEEGHLLQDYVAESAERDINTGGLSYRKTRKPRKKKKQAAPSPYYKGERSRFLMFQTGQLLLRQQIHAIMELWDLPTELEIVARDLWGIYISATDLAPEPHLAQQEREQEEAAADAQSRHRSTSPANADDIEQLFNSTSASETEVQEDDDDGSDTEATESDADPEPDAEDPIIEAVEKPYAGPTRARRRGATAKEALNPAHVFHAHFTLAICYLACLYLRVPLFMHDILELAATGQIPYIGFAMTLPQEMRGIMPPAVRSVFMPPDVISVLSGNDESVSFHAWISRFMKLYLRYGISFPMVNAPPLLARCTRHLLLPPAFYHAAKRLLHLFDFDMHFLSDEPSQKLNKGRSDLKTFNMSLVAPDSLIVAAVLLVTKLHWALDDRPRGVDPDKDPVASELPTQKAYLKALEERMRGSHGDNIGELLRKDVSQYDDDEMDAFLDHCQTTLIQEERQDDNRAPSRFPLQESTRASQALASDERLLAILQKMYEDKNRMSPLDDKAPDPLWPCGEGLAFSAKTKSTAPPYRAWAQVRDRMAIFSGYTTSQLDRVVRELEERLIVKMGSKVVKRQKKKRRPVEDSEWVEDSEDSAAEQPKEQGVEEAASHTVDAL